MGIDERRILYADDYLLAVNKLAGELVVRGKGAVGKLPLLDFLRKQYPGLRAVHRLDFATSGVVVFARSRSVLQKILDTKFAQWEKMYWGLVKGGPKREGVIRIPLPTRGQKHSSRKSGRPGVMVRCPAGRPFVDRLTASYLRVTKQRGHEPSPGGSGEECVPAETRYKVLEVFGDASLVEAVMVTGRHHQIRRHFAAIGHPLALDDVYGDQVFNRQFTREYGYHRFFLHAARLRFPHPVTGEILTIAAPLPRVFEECLGQLRGD